jgi:hypothetical protein
MRLTIEISPGELLDRITILEIKCDLLDDKTKLDHVRFELSKMRIVIEEILKNHQDIQEYKIRLKAVNLDAWNLIELMETNWSSGQKVSEEIFHEAYRLNKERVRLKQAVDVLLGSSFVEEKSYLPPAGRADRI